MAVTKKNGKHTFYIITEMNIATLLDGQQCGLRFCGLSLIAGNQRHEGAPLLCIFVSVRVSWHLEVSSSKQYELSAKVIKHVWFKLCLGGFTRSYMHCIIFALALWMESTPVPIILFRRAVPGSPIGDEIPLIEICPSFHVRNSRTGLTATALTLSLWNAAARSK